MESGGETSMADLFAGRGVLIFVTGSQCVAQVGLEFVIFLFHPLSSGIIG